MKFLAGPGRGVVSVAIAAVLAAVVVVLAPRAARWITLYYLDQQGVQASIGEVDADLLTGTLEYTDIEGHTEQGDGFDIGHLRLSLDYMPLFSRQISLSRLAVDDAAVDIRRSRNNALRIGGISVRASPPRDGGSFDWGLALHQLTIGKLRLRYMQPANGQQPAIDRELTLNNASVSDVVSWQPGSDVPLDANISVGKSQIQIKGRVTPFGPTISGHFELAAHDFDLDLLAPITQPSGMRQLTGTVDGQQQIDIHYEQKKALAVTIDGKTGWRDARLTLAGGLKLTGDRLDWQGTVTMKLLRAAGKPATIDSDGHLRFTGFRLHQPDNVTLEQQKGDWRGKTTIALAAPTVRVNTNGALKSDRMRLTRPGNTRFNADALNWQGTTQTAVAAGPTKVDGNGRLNARHIDFSELGNLDLDTGPLNWRGTFEAVAGPSTKVDTDGNTDADKLTFAIPGAAVFRADHINWRGQTHIDSAQLLARQARGTLTATASRLMFPNQPLALSADRMVFDGHYSEKPGSNALKLSVAGAIDSHALAVTNTAIDAPWLAMLQVHGEKLDIDGIDSIALAGLTAHGVRLLGDTNTDAAVLTSTTTKVKQFRLDKRRHYHLADLNIDGANIHLRRDAGGMGVIAKYFGGDRGPSKSTSSDSTSPAKSTYALDHLAVTGPAVAFTDVAVEPRVALTGSDLNFILDDLDTAQPDRNASYRLSLDVSAYGHLDSRGKIAPRAPGGPRMDLDAWLRSLALGPMSGYLNAAMGRRIARGVADGTLHLEATRGQLDGLLDTTLSNFLLAKNSGKPRTIALGISMDTALGLVRGKADAIHFQTKILGDVTNPYFSIKNLVREAVLAGVRTALTSDYSPIGLLNNAKNALVNLGRSLVSKPVGFEPGKHYVRPEDRSYLSRIARTMFDKPELTLTVRGYAVPGDADAMPLFHGAQTDRDNRVSLQELARKRGQAVRDYLAARRVNPDRITLATPRVEDGDKARPEAKLWLDSR